MSKKTRTLALSSLMVAIMLILGYVESMLPTGPVPGIKIGLSNSVLLIVLYSLGVPACFILMTAKVVLSGLLFSGVSAMMYSFAGGLLSVAVMSLLSRFKGFSCVGVGISGGVMHNVGQVGLAMIVLNTDSLVYYMAILMIVGAVMGAATGTICKLMIARLPQKFFVGGSSK